MWYDFPRSILENYPLDQGDPLNWIPHARDHFFSNPTTTIFITLLVVVPAIFALISVPPGPGISCVRNLIRVNWCYWI